MIKKNIKEKSYNSRIEIIQGNFFKYLEKNKVTQKKYAVDNNISISTISKWKNNTSCMNEEHIIAAAKYFKISVNQLYYTEQELKELKVNEDVNYDPIIAQHHVKINFFHDCLNKPFSTVLQQTIVAAVVVLFVLLLGYFKWTERLLLFLVIFIFAIISFIAAGRKETFNINYLDDIYYHIDSSKNKNFVLELIISIIQGVLSVLALVALFFINATKYDDITMTKTAFFIGLFTSCIMIVGIFFNEKELEQEYYDIVTPNLLFSYINYNTGLVMSGIFVCLAFVDFSSNWYLLFSILIPVFGYIKYHLTCKKYSEYKIVYYEHSTNSSRILFDE